MLSCEIASHHGDPWTAAELKETLGLSTTEVYASLRRCREAGLLGAANGKLFSKRLLELLVHGVRYVYYAELGPPKLGVPTGYSSPRLEAELHLQVGQALVWESPHGSVVGTTIRPLYRTVPEACLRSPGLYELLSLVDAIRVGRTRERRIAARLLGEMLDD